MVAELFANEASAALAVPLAPSDVSFTVSAASGFPATTTGVSQFRARIRKAAADSMNTHEYIVVTNISGNVWTVVRGSEGSSAQSWVVGSIIEPVLTAAVVAGFAQKSMANVDPNDVKALLGLGTAAFQPTSAFDASGAAATAVSTAAADATSKVAAEASARASAISAAIATEITNRNAAIATAIATEVTNRNSALNAEVSARNSAISSAVSSALATAAADATTKVAAEAVSRAAAIAQEVTDRNAAIAAAIDAIGT